MFLLVSSFFAFDKLPKEMFPPAALEKIVVSGSYYGSSSEVLDDLIVRDCEEILRDNPALENLETSITKGSYTISAQLKSSYSKTLVINDIKSKIDQLDIDLPKNMKMPVVYGVENFFPLMSISVYSTNNSYKKDVKIIKELNEDIKRLEHIYQSEILGKLDKTLRISLYYDKVKAYGLHQNETLKAISELFSIYPIGKIESDTNQYLVSTKTTQLSKQYLEDLSLHVEGKTLQLKDIADISYLYEKHSLTTRTNGKNSIIIMIKKAKEGDSMKLSSEIRELLHSYENTYPHMKFEVLNDSSFWIKSRLNVVSSNIIIGLILLFFAMWIFISLRVSIVVIIGVPVSFAFGIIGLDFFDNGLNTLSMIGVLLSLGLLVDEAIVVSENINRHLSMGKEIKDACIDGTLEVLPALFVALLTTVLAFIPLLFLSGGLGVFVKIIPFMVIILIVSSFIESFVFLPSHYRMLFRWGSGSKKSYKDRMWDILDKLYKNLLIKLIKYKKSAISALVLFLLISSYFMLKNSQFILFPEFDAMSINISGKVPYNSLKYTSEEIKPIEELLLQNLKTHNYASIHTAVGMKTDGRGAHERSNNLFTITINLKPKIADDYFNREINPLFQLFGQWNQEERTRVVSAKQMKQEMQEFLKEYEKAFSLQISIPQTGVTKSDVSLSLSHKDDAVVHQSITKLKEKIATMRGIENIKDDMNYDDISLIIEPNAYAAELGFTQNNLIDILSNYLRSDDISKVSNNEHELLELKLSINNKNSFENFENLHIKIPNKNIEVALRDVVNIVYKKSLSSIKKENMLKIFTLSADLDKSVLNSRAFYKEIEPLLTKMKEDGIIIIIGGEAGKNKQVQNDILLSFVFSFFAILIVLSLFFNSLRLSLFSLSVIPLSVFGVLLGHQIVGLSLTFSSLLGFVGLIGIILNDTLIMIDFIKKATNRDELVLFAAKRLKPIVLTSITTVLGLFTLMFFASGESLLMQPLAVSIGFGLVGATLINLLYIPVAFSILKIRDI